MDTTTPQPTLAGPAQDPQINLLQTRLVTLNLVTRAGEADCHFWIGLAAPGSQTPAGLLDQGEVASLLTSAATTGVSEDGPLMLSDTSVEPPRYVFLLPVPGDEFRDRAVWIHELVGSLKAWAPPSIGFYIAPEAMVTEKGLDLLLAVLRAVICEVPTSSYHLLTGTHGINSVLNAALKLKTEMDGDNLSLHVFH